MPAALFYKADKLCVFAIPFQNKTALKRMPLGGFVFGLTFCF